MSSPFDFSIHLNLNLNDSGSYNQNQNYNYKTWESSNIGQCQIVIKTKTSSPFLHIGNMIVQYLRMKVPTLALTFGMIAENHTCHEPELILRILSQIPLQSQEVSDFLYEEECVSCDTKRRQETFKQRGRIDLEEKENHEKWKEMNTHDKRMQGLSILNHNLPGCPKCCAKFILSVENPSTSKECLQVTTDHLKRVPLVSLGETDENMSHPSVQVIRLHAEDPPIPLFRLAPGQAFHAVLLALKNNGLKHTIYSPVGPCSFAHFVKVKVHKESLDCLNTQEKKQLVETCIERNLFEYDSSSSSSFRVRNDIRKCNRCYACMEFAYEKNLPRLIAFEDRFDEFLLSIGLVGSLGAPQAIDLATQEMKNTFEAILNSFEEMFDF